MNTKMSKLALAIGALVMAGGAWAADTSTMAASATVAAECAVANGAALSLGTLVMLNLDTATQTTVDTLGASTFAAICTNGTKEPKFAYSSLNTEDTNFRLKGTNATANDYITYTLYSSADSTAAPITGGTALAYGGATEFLADGTSKTLAVSAKIAAADKAAKLVQAYTDTVTITASWTL